MFSVVTDLGISSLTAVLSGGSKIVLKNYAIGYINPALLPNLRDDEDNSVALANIKDQTFITENFVTKYTGVPGDMTYTPVTENKLTVKCVTPADTDQFTYNAVIILASINGVDFVMSTQYYLAVNPKFNLEISKGGMFHYFLETYRLYKFALYFDVSALGTSEPTFIEYDDYLALPRANSSREDQSILKVHPVMENNGDPHVLFVAGNQWYGIPTREVDFSDPSRDAIFPYPEKSSLDFSETFNSQYVGHVV